MPATQTTVAVAQLVREGRITTALQHLQQEPDHGVESHALQLECRLARGEMEQAIGLGERLADVDRTDPDDRRRASMALGELHAATGHDEQAVAAFRQVARVAEGDEGDDPISFPWRSAAAISMVRLGQSREAAELAQQQLRLVRHEGSAYDTAAAIRTAAAVGVASDRHEQLREAHDLVAGSYRRLAAQVATDLAALVALGARTRADHTEAVALLRDAEEYADVEDLWPLHSRIRRLLELLGEQPVVAVSEAVARLSHAELRVARLAARGGTNRAIAEELEVTVKAVEWHLGNTYRKLGIEGRPGLPRMLRVG